MVPRALAVRVLTRVLSDKEPLDRALAAVMGEVPSEQRAWLQEVCSGTLRWKGRLDFVIDANSLKKKPSGWLRKVLLIAAYQLIAQERTSPGAVVSETVNEIKSREGAAPAGFANALLRKIADHAVEWRNLPLATNASLADAAQWASMPEWLWKRLVNQYGSEWARAYALASLERPVVWARAKRADWVPEWGEPGPVAGAWRVKQSGAIQDKLGFGEGEFIIQDVSSQRLIEDVTDEVKLIGPSKTALDLCAAPGGKSVGMSWKGFDVTASDLDGPRIELLATTVQRVGAGIRIVPSSGLAKDVFDLVWVDAPCSGTGIIRRHPDIRWLRQEKELAALIRSQRELLHTGWERVREGGYLVYSVCSVLKEEGPEAIETAHMGKPIHEWFLCPQDEPHGDGFWAALFQKS